MLYSVNSECQLIEQVHYHPALRRFIGLSLDDEVWVTRGFIKNRERLIKHGAVIDVGTLS